MDISLSLLAQAEQPGWQSFLPFIVIFAAMYFLIIAPQRKKQKQHQKMITELKSGTEVMTSGGIYGTITNVKEDRFVLKIAENTKIEISKASVSAVINAAE
ncbi:preprotein translocase, YajC subunit [Verrucomicrobiia bacterium DG1235]|nr:preprotein translocase, YajC subunit [Verrucomicrobiae bacterium DG1235]